MQTIKEMVIEINKILKADFERPVIKKNLVKSWVQVYDQVKGQKLNDIMDIEKLFNFAIGSHQYCCSWEKAYTILKFYGTPMFKTKRRLSEMVSITDRTKKMTIYSIELIATEYENYTLDDLLIELETRANIKKQAVKDDAKNKYDNFKSFLTSKNITGKEFKDMLEMYASLNYNYKSKITQQEEE